MKRSKNTTWWFRTFFDYIEDSFRGRFEFANGETFDEVAETFGFGQKSSTKFYDGRVKGELYDKYADWRQSGDLTLFMVTEKQKQNAICNWISPVNQKANCKKVEISIKKHYDPILDSDFVQSLISLNSALTSGDSIAAKSLYREFVNDYGTHYAVKAVMGSR